MFEVRGIALGLHHGFNKVRFLAPVRVGSRVRMRARLLSVRDVGQASSPEAHDSALVTVEQVFEIEGEARPACVAESLVMYFG
jgi:acyl dehydratase